MAVCLASMEMEFIEDVGPSYGKGVQDLDRFVLLLRDTNVKSAISTREANALVRKLSPPITKACKEFDRASRVAQKLNDKIGQEIEEGVVKQHQLEQHIRRNEVEESDLSKRLLTIESDIRDAESQVRNARSELSTAEGTLRKSRSDLRDKRDTRDVVRGFGIGLSLTGIGLIVGGPLLAISETALTEAVENAENARDVAENNVGSCQRRLERKKKENEELVEKLRTKQQERQAKQHELRDLQENLSQRRQAQKKAVKLGQNLKYCTTFITTTFGRTKVLRNEVKNLYTLETLQGPLLAINDHFKKFSCDSQLLFGEFKSGLSLDSQKLRMICAKSTEPIIAETNQWC